MTGFVFASFRILIREVRRLMTRADRRERTVGRPRLLHIEDELGIYLLYVNSMMRTKHLAVIFGVLPSKISETIRYIMVLVVKALRRHDDAKVSFPSLEEMRRYSEMIARREPLVDDVIGFLDGVSLPVQCSDDPIE
jgi:hypothetical protein